MPLEARLTLLFVVGLFGGSLVNWACYSLAWTPRPLSPWSKGPQGMNRSWGDTLPLFGWILMRREAAIHGRGFWIRPFFVELAFGIGLAWLYWWEVDQNALLPRAVGQLADTELKLSLDRANHLRFAVHAMLLGFMAVASLIDVDERIIPDSVTIPGTLFGLLSVSLFPSVLLPVAYGDPDGRLFLGFLSVTSPAPPPEWFHGYPQVVSAVVGLAAWWLWIFALLPRTWYARHGTKRALGLMCARLCRERFTGRLVVLGLIGSAVILSLWATTGRGWFGLLTGLIGMIAGALLIWAVRIVGSRSLKSEAMGFGDVTLMAMIGVYVGWQSCLVVFFLAAMYALGIALFNYLVLRDRSIYFGPFLCLGAATVIVFWEPVWARIEGIAALGWLIPAFFVACMALMAILLTGWRKIREMVWGW